MTTAAELASYASSFPSFRNRIINGDMRIDQRNGGSSYSFAHDGTTNGYTLDRFQFTLVNSDEFDCTITQYSMSSSEIATTGHSNALKLLTGTAETTVGNDEYVRIIQRVEAQNLQDLKHGTASAKPSILSFWVKSSEEGTYGLNLYRYVRSGSARNINLSYKIDVADTWEHKTIPISGDTGGDLIPDTNENGLFINWQLAAGSNYNSTASTSWADYASTRAFGNYSNSVATTASATFYITGVQLEEGTVATPFEHRPYGTELALCQRYYERWNATSGNGDVLFNGQAISTNQVLAGPFHMKVTKRALPEITYSNASHFAFTNAANSNNPTGSLDSTVVNKDTFRLYASSIATNPLVAGNCSIVAANTSSAYVEMKAEL